MQERQRQQMEKYWNTSSNERREKFKKSLSRLEVSELSSEEASDRGSVSGEQWDARMEMIHALWELKPIEPTQRASSRPSVKVTLKQT